MFRDRLDAGGRLAEELLDFDLSDPVVLGLPRGGVVVAAPVARALEAALDVIIVRKLGTPGNPELGMGAIAEGGVTVVNDRLVREFGITADEIDRVAGREHAELARRVREYRGKGRPVPLEGRTAVIVDDGLATGYTAMAAVESARHRNASRVVLAVPVGAPDTVARLGRLADDVVCIDQPRWMTAVGASYGDFRQTSDAEVEQLLADHGPRAEPGTHELEMDVEGVVLPGILAVPAAPTGIVVFAHGSGSSRLSPRNAAVAGFLNDAGLATLLFDLLTDREAADRGNVFDIPLLGRRLGAVARWLDTRRGTSRLPLGYFGASTGAAAALVAAAEHPDVAAVVSRGGRADLAGEALGAVEAPTLLVVGSHDVQVLELNRQAAAQMNAPVTVEVVPGAGHLFEEPGTLERVAGLAAGFFLRELRSPSA